MNMAAVLCVFVLLCAYAQGIQVNTTEGVVEGHKAGDGDYYVFFGIPYAGNTDGNNRFKAPVPPSPYPGLFHAIDSNVICAQPTERGLIGVENCLRLSISTKNVTTPKPVIVWLNAEEYTTTNTELRSPKRFVEENIVFVSLNFRLSIFGFLCLGVEEAPGNAGLKDVLQGLKWINANIANFGGDPKNVVLMGHASGAAIVDLITMAPQAKDLVHKAVALSGSALSPWAVAYDPVGYAQLLGEKLGYTDQSKKKLAQHLLKTELNVLQTALTDFNFQNNTPLFAPCIENTNLSSNDTVLADAPLNLLRAGNYLQIPYIAGYVNKEGTMRASKAAFGNWLDAMQANFSDFMPVDLNLLNNKTAVVAAVRDYYFGSSPISIATIEDYLDYHGDTLVLVSVIRGAKERSLISSAEVRLLEFGYLGTLNSDWIYNQIPLSGVRHGGILNYFFDFDLKPSDAAVMMSLVQRFAAFASTGTPNLPSARTSQIWSAITRDQLNYFYYGGSDRISVTNTTVEEMRINPHIQRMSFWGDLIAKYYVPPSGVNSSSKLFCSIIFVMLTQLIVFLY